MKKLMILSCVLAAFAVSRDLLAASVDVPQGTTVKISDYTLETDFNLSGGTLEFDVASGAEVEYAGRITGQGTIEKTGDGSLTFTGGESLTAESTLKATGGRFRFKDFAAAGGATLVGNGGFFGNVAGSAIIIPASTVVTGSPLQFYAEGDGTNIVVENCSRLTGLVAVFGDSLASIVKFAGQVPMDSETTYHYVAARTGTALLASEMNGFDYFQTVWMGGLGGLMLGDSSSALIGDVSMVQRGRLDVAGASAQIKALYAHDAVSSPLDVVVTNSAPADAVLTMSKGGGQRPRYVARDGEKGLLTMCYDATNDKGEDLSDALFQNRALTIRRGAFSSSSRTADFNRAAWKTSPGVSGRYVRLVVTNSTVGSSQFLGQLRIAEFRLTLGGRPVAWPAGTTASSPNVQPGASWGEEGLDCTAQAMIDGDMNTFWHPADFVVGDHPATNIIDMTREVAFNGYQMAAGGDNKSALPSGWTLDVGRKIGDEIVWEQVTGAWPDEKIGESSPSDRNYYMQMWESLGRYYEDCVLPLNAADGVKTWQGPQFQGDNFALTVQSPGSLTLTDHLESMASLTGDGALALNGSRLFVADAAAFTGALTADATSFVGGGSTLSVNGTLTIGNAEAANPVETDVLDDTALVSIGEHGRLALRQAHETVGGLAGIGAVDLGGGSLTLTESVESNFSGSFTGGGALIWSNGTFRGAAKAEGDYTVRLDGGSWAGRLDVSGALTLDGNLVVDASGLEPGRHTLFTFGSLGADSEAAVAAAVVSPKPEKPFRARLLIEDNAVKLDVYIGFMVILR